MCEKMIVWLAMKLYDYMLNLTYLKKTLNAQSILLYKPNMVSPATTCQQTKQKPAISLEIINTVFGHYDVFHYFFANINDAASCFFTSFKQSLKTDFLFHWSCSGPYFNHFIKYCVTFVLLYFQTRLSTSFSISYNWYVGMSVSISTVGKWLNLER